MPTQRNRLDRRDLGPDAYRLVADVLLGIIRENGLGDSLTDDEAINAGFELLEGGFLAIEYDEERETFQAVPLAPMRALRNRHDH